MTDDHDFDDPSLRDELMARSGGSVEPAAGRAAVVARANRIRTRRTVALGGAAAALIVVGLAAIPFARDDGSTPNDELLPAASTPDDATTNPDVPSTTSDVGPTATSDDDEVIDPDGAGDDRVDDDDRNDDQNESIGSAPVTTSSSSDGSAAPSPTTTEGQSTAPAGPPDTDPTTTPTAIPTTSPTPPSTPDTLAPTTTAPTTTPSTTVSSAPPSTDPAPVGDPPFTQQYSSAGGSITVRWDGSALSLLSVDAAAGFTSEIEDQRASRIRVRFRSDDDDARIEVRADDGRVSSTVS